MTYTPTTTRRALLAGAAGIVACLLVAGPASASGIPIPPAPTCAEARERVDLVTNQLMGEQIIAKAALDRSKLELRDAQRGLSRLQATVVKDQQKGRVTPEFTRMQIDSLTKTVGRLVEAVGDAQKRYDAARARSSANKTEGRTFLRKYCGK